MKFNFDKNSAELRIDRSIYLGILKNALDQTAIDVDALDLAFAEKDILMIQAISHRWKGDFANLRLAPLAEIAKQLNDASKTENDFKVFKKIFDQFRAGFNELKQAATVAASEG